MLLAVPLLGADSAATAPAAGGDLRVMTFNIRYGTANDGDDSWKHRRELVFDVLRKHRPDAVGLQEALRFQIDEIRKAVPGYEEIGAGRDDGREKGEYSAILYRSDRLRAGEQGTFWYSDTPQKPGSKTWGNNLPRVCTWARLLPAKSGSGLRPFYLFNTHLDHQSQPSRERSAELLAARIGAREHRDPVIVTGDFNVAEDNPVIRYLKGKVARASTAPDEAAASPALVDTYRVLHPEKKESGTFNGFKGTRGGAKIDYILAPQDVRVLEAAILHDNSEGRYPSDHFPVLAVLRLPE